MVESEPVWLGSGFHASVISQGDRPAISTSEGEVSYRQLSSRVARLAELLEPEADGPALTAILAAGGVSTYAGILAALYCGDGYVPLNPKFPADRLSYMLTHSGARRLIVDEAHTTLLEDVIADAEPGLTILFADADEQAIDALKASYPAHTVLAGAGASEQSLRPPQVTPDDVAYILYTSGSTGHPKGVAVSHANVAHFLSVMLDRYAYRAEDRFSHMFDLSFDLSVFDMFMAWYVGGCLCLPTANDAKLPSDYVLREELTIWFSVPSLAVLMDRLRQLETGRFPSLRMAMFCGEALPAEAAKAWCVAAPNATLQNVYGPTEVTLACTWYDIPEDPVSTAVNGVVPIGTAYTGMTALVADDALNPVAPGGEGELCMSGPQVALGYWRDPAKTDAAFVTHPETGERYYRTGDLVRAPQNADAPIVYLGRIDHQIKLHGHRIELGEIEATLSKAVGVTQAVIVPWPLRDGVPQGLVGFVEKDSLDLFATQEKLRETLPDYMIPKRVECIDRFPLNVNGKIDRRALVEILKA